MNTQFVAEKLLEHDQHFDELKNEIDDKFNRIMTVLDYQTGILRRLDQERLFTNTRLDRHEKRITGLEDKSFPHQ